MLKKSLAWMLTLALLLGTVSGLVLVSVAAGEGFAYASFASGQDLYKNGSRAVYSHNVLSSPMAGITGNAADRYAAYLGYQNNQVGVDIPMGVIDSPNLTLEIKFWADPDNQGETRLGISYTSVTGDVNPGNFQLKGAAGAETFSVGADIQATGTVETAADGWKTAVVQISDANYNGGGKVVLTKWSHDNGDNTPDGWYIQSILLYEAEGGRPTEEQLYIRENTVGYIDFTDEMVEKELLDYTVNDKASIVDFDGMKALKIAGGNGFNLTVTADEVAQPAVLASDSRVTLLLETYVDRGTNGDWGTRFCVQDENKYPFIYGNGHELNTVGGYAWNKWEVMRFDITDNAGVQFKLGSWFNGDATLYIRKIVICRTELVSTNTYENAFVDFDNPVAIYNDFQRVKTTDYNISWSTSEFAEGDSATVDIIEGKTAITAPSGYLYLNVADTFPKKGNADVADLNFTVTYLDKGTGVLELNYNAILPPDVTDPIPYNFKGVKIADLTDSGEWKTATVYVEDACLRNAQNGGNDARIALNGRAISAVSVAIGANKYELYQWLNKPFNAAAYTAEVVEAYKKVKAAAQLVADNKYATQAQVDAAVAELITVFDSQPLPGPDYRYNLNGASWTPDKTQGSIESLNGWFVWKFAAGSDHWMGIGDPDGILADSESVTYEYEILMDTVNLNNRCFLSYGETKGWHGIEEGAWKEDAETGDYTGNGFAAHGGWGDVPEVGDWGTVKIVNNRYDPTKTSDKVDGAITALGAWFDDGTLHVRSVKVYDTADPTKVISLTFNEDVAEVIPFPDHNNVVPMEKEGHMTYKIPGEGWLALNIDSQSLMDQGVVSKGAMDVVIEVCYWLDEWENGVNGNELLMIKHYNPDGNGQNGDKSSVCEHQFNSSSKELQNRGQWVTAKFVLHDADFGAQNKEGKPVLNITYGNGSNIYIRGIRVCEIDANGVMVSERQAQWGSFPPPEPVPYDYPTFDWTADKGYLLDVRFSEGRGVDYGEFDGYRAVIITDDLMYVNVDDGAIPASQKFVRIDITHQNGCALHVEYNTVLPEGVDASTEPNLTYYNFRSSNGIHKIVDGNNVGQGDEEYTNPLGVIRSVSDEHYDWMTTSIYLTDAQFRNACNGADFRVRVFGGAVITRIEVHPIVEADIPAVGDATALRALHKELVEKYNYDFGDNTALEEAFYAAEDFLKFHYRASQAEIDAALNALQAIGPGGTHLAGDVDGDGSITSTDARLVLQYYAGKITADDLDISAANVDGDNEITSTDARLILQYYAGKITAWP